MPPESLDREPPVPVLIEKWAATQPDATFCVEVAGRSLTYAGFVAEASRWSRALAAAGAGRGDLVLTMIPTSCDGLAVWMGIARLRAIDAAVNTGFTGRMLEYIVADTGARVAIVHADYLARFAQLTSLASLTQIVVIGGHAPQAHRLPGHGSERIPRGRPAPARARRTPGAPRCELRDLYLRDDRAVQGRARAVLSLIHI